MAPEMEQVGTLVSSKILGVLDKTIESQYICKERNRKKYFINFLKIIGICVNMRLLKLNSKSLSYT